MWHWQFIMVSAILTAAPIFLPRFGLASMWRKHPECPVDHLISSYAQGMTFPTFVIATGSALIAWLLTEIILGLILSPLFATALWWLAYLVVRLVEWTLFVAVEEYWKITFAISAKARRQHRVGDTDTLAHTLGSLAGGIGYATAQGIAIVILLCAGLDDASSAGGKTITPEETGLLVWLGLLLALMNIPLHSITSYLEGLDVTAGDKTMFEMLKLPVAIRSVFIFQFFFNSAVWWGALHDLSAGFAICMMWIFIVLSIGGIYYGVYRILKTKGVDLFAANAVDAVFGYAALSDGQELVTTAVVI
jgi:hypothetical protein